jgi:hypothetical protein
MPTAGQFHVDHIVPPALWLDYAAGRIDAVPPIEGRRGPDHLDNFAWSCPFCNSAKRDRVAHAAGRVVSRLYDPRRDRWPEHFAFFHRYLFVVGLTAIGTATERTLAFNDSRLGGPLGTRHEAVLRRHYPPPWAHTWQGSSRQ